MKDRVITLGRAAARHRFVRFLATGVVNTAFGYCVFLLGLAAGLRPEVALAVATAIGAVFNYVTTARIVFGHRAWRQLPVFVATYGVLYAVNALAIHALIAAGISAALAQAMLTPVMAVVSFLLFRNLVFRAVVHP